jgi:hypothetical protein
MESETSQGEICSKLVLLELVLPENTGKSSSFKARFNLIELNFLPLVPLFSSPDPFLSKIRFVLLAELEVPEALILEFIEFRKNVLLLFGRGILDPLVFKLEEVFFEADD